MSHGPASEQPAAVNANPEPVSNPPELFSKSFMKLREQEESALLDSIQVLALASVPVYVQTDCYRSQVRQHTRLEAGQREDLLNEHEARRAKMYYEKKPLDILIAKHVIEAIPKGEDESRCALLESQCNLLVAHNKNKELRRSIRYVDVDGDIHLQSYDYYLLRVGGWYSLYVCGGGHEQFYEHGSPEIDEVKSLYAAIGRRAVSEEDTNAYLDYLASHARLSACYSRIERPNEAIPEGAIHYN